MASFGLERPLQKPVQSEYRENIECSGNDGFGSTLVNELNATQPDTQDSQSTMAPAPTPSEEKTTSCEEAGEATEEIKANGADKQDNATQPILIDSNSAMPMVSAVASVLAESPITEEMNKKHKVEEVLKQPGDVTDMVLSDMSDINSAADHATSSNDEAAEIADGNEKIEGEVAGGCYN